MAELLEQYVPVVQQNGLKTNKAAVFGGAVSFTGAVTKNSNVLGSAGNTTLTAAQSGSTVLFDTAAGITFTLPAPVVGLDYTFIVATTVTSSNHKVITNAGTVFMAGALAVMEASGSTNLGALGNGSSHLSVLMNGTTTGGILGTKFTLTCISATVWEASGIVAGSGTLATPFSTS